MRETNFTFRVGKGLKVAFAKAARAEDRPASLLLRDFMRDYVQRHHERAAHDEWFRGQVLESLRDADDPKTPRLSHSNVEALFRRLRAGPVPKAVRRQK